MGSHASDARAVLDAIRHIVRALRVTSRASETAFGVTSAQLFVLQQLKDGGTLSVNELAQRTLTHQSSVSVVVGRLAERGLVERTTSPVDARRTDLKLTARGSALLRRAPDPLQIRLIAVLRALPRKELAQLARTLTHVVTEAGLSSGEAPDLFFEHDGGSHA